MRRNVVYFGIDRVVPHAEKSVYKSYRHRFASAKVAGWEQQVKNAVAMVLGHEYDNFSLRAYGKHRLPVVSFHGQLYSGFNMGAGEKALFELFSVLYAAPEGTLFVIDEIELGLHAKAQRRLVNFLKDVVEARKIQVICTTHSEMILSTLPPEGRFFVERLRDQTLVTPGISPAYATGKLGGENSRELDVYVEDTFAQSLLTAAFPHQLRQRVSVVPVGSPETVLSQLAARYRDLKQGEAVAVLDGDKAPELQQLHQRFASWFPAQRREHALRWIADRIVVLPSLTPPERYVLDQLLGGCDLSRLAGTLHTDVNTLREELEPLRLEDPHDFVHLLSNGLQLAPDGVEPLVCHFVAESFPEHFAPVVDLIQHRLE